MKKKSKVNNLSFEIERDLPEVGFYLYVFDENDKCIADHLQDDENMVKRFAHEEYGVPINSWIENK